MYASMEISYYGNGNSLMGNY